MSQIEVLFEKIQRKPPPKNFTVQDLDSLMSKCGCIKKSGGRGSSLKYIHEESMRVLTFDEPHPGKDLYSYQIKKACVFLKDIGIIKQ
jgi:hypothetical protein